MKIKPADNVKLGLFVLAGLLFMVFSLYMIGKNRNLFGATFVISAHFKNTNGLVVGNNVRFSGIDVGTVTSIDIDSDTAVQVTMVIEKKVRPYIRQNAVASIGSEGLMGNKLININSQPGEAPPVENGSVIGTLHPIETDEMLRTLNTTNNNFEGISSNLREITAKLNRSNSLWELLSDTVIAMNLRHAMTNIDKASENTEELTDRANDLLAELKAGRGPVKTLFTDTVMTHQLHQTITDVQTTSQELAAASRQLKQSVASLEKGPGVGYMLLHDSIASARLRQSIANVEQGTSRFNENMEALKHNFLFRKYFKKQEKKQK